MITQNSALLNQTYRQLVLSSLPWLFSAVMIFVLLGLMLTLQNVNEPKEDSLIVRQVDVTLPPPPPPPPPIEIEQVETESETPTIDLIGLGNGPSMRYSDTPTLGKVNIEKVKKPEFDLNSLNFKKTISLDFPVIEVKNLDSRPRVISVKNPSIPKTLRNRGITFVPAKVDIIIDNKGRAYIKKIVDPIYPEMIISIRQWVSSVRFTIPTKNGRPVQAIYHYTLNFRHRN